MITRVHRSRQLSMPPENQDSPNSDSHSLLPHYQPQSSYHEENYSHLRIDDNRWMRDLENMLDDSIR